MPSRGFAFTLCGPVYDLQCPLCSAQESSPFVRVGAVVHCPSCTGRYRIKSSQVTRNVTTGPRTLDELDPLLSGDSVDLDPDTDASPVKIDDQGHVVGLSGLSELMRQSDAKQAKAGVKKRAKDAAAVKPPPVAKVTRSAKGKSKAAQTPAPKSKPAAASPVVTRPPDAPVEDARERAQQRARQRRLQTKLMIAAIGGTVTVVILALLLLFAISPDEPEAPRKANSNPAKPDHTQADPPPDPEPDLREPIMFPRDRDDSADPDSDSGTLDISRDPDPSDPQLFGHDRHYSTNPSPRYVASAMASNGGDRPAEVPALLTEPQILEHEGWYILSPPRGFADAVGETDVELSELKELFTNNQGQTILVGTLTNRGETAAIAGEAHVALLDPAGRVFAETYLPFALLEPGASMSVRLAIAERFWERARGNRTHAIVSKHGESIQPLANVRLEPIGTGPSAAVRVSVRNEREQWLRDAVLVLTASDLDGSPVARFRVAQDDLFIAAGDWLDMVVHTPMPEADNARYQWSATLHVPVRQ